MYRSDYKTSMETLFSDHIPKFTGTTEYFDKIQNNKYYLIIDLRSIYCFVLYLNFALQSIQLEQPTT